MDRNTRLSDFQAQFERCKQYLRANSPAYPKLKLLKGGAYSIKQYYLENNKLDDIRGASALLAYTEETVIPDFIGARFPKDCIIYNGGGNVFCLLPYETEDDFALETEREAEKYLISAKIAFVMQDSDIGSIEQHYADTIRALEAVLNERRKLKLSIALNRENPFFADKFIPWHGKLSFPKSAVSKKGGICELCKTRIAAYRAYDTELCSGCLNKKTVGREMKHIGFVNSYEQFIKAHPSLNGVSLPITPPSSLSDIDSEHIAVVYGDGNNMGQLISNIKDITGMMEFSDSVKGSTKHAVYLSMAELGIDKFEIVGLGGDDMFLIVPADKAFELAVRIIEEYNSFNKSSTMSVGICIAKYNMPIRIMLECAEDKLAEAKDIAKLDRVHGCDCGTIGFAVIDNYTQDEESPKNRFGALMSAAPYNSKAARELIDFIKRLKRLKTAKGAQLFSSSRLRSVYDAYQYADCMDECELFAQYSFAKNGELLGKYLPNLYGYTKLNNSGLYRRNFADSDEGLVIWRDILELYKYIGD